MHAAVYTDALVLPCLTCVYTDVSAMLPCVTSIHRVHERQLDGDFLLALLLPLLRARPALRIILMSATVDTARFAGYFRKALGDADTCPVLHIPGRTFPVQHFTLEEVSSSTYASH